MGDLRRFTGKRVGPQAPPRLGEAERAEWAAMVERLRSVGMLSRTTSPALTKYCKRYVRTRVLSEDSRRLNALRVRLSRLAQRLEGADARTVHEAERQLAEQWLGNADESRRTWLTMRAFLSRHRLTPLSRAEAE